MTENEAIKHLQSYAEVVDNMIKYCKDFEPKADITGYLEKKTVFAMAISALKEVQKYNEIGTVEECREAVERQKAKKIIPIKEGLLYESGWRNRCLSCRCAVGENIYHPDVTKDYEYCSMCGQAIYE